jgi:hypothetical protein
MTDAFEAAFDEVWKAGNGSSGAAGKQQQAASDGTGGAQWPEPIDVIGAPDLVGWPTLTAECLPEPLYRYVMGEAERLNVDPCPLAANVIAACSAAVSDAWRIKPKQHDSWTQQARVWSCVVKDVGARGTEMIRSAFWSVRDRDKKLFDQWLREHAAWEERQAERKKGSRAEHDPEPKLKRLTTQDATIDAASQILADGDDHAKLTLICDELSGFLGGFGRYSPNGAAARAQWLESYDGGPRRIDRIKRGHIYVPNWSVIVAGNVQPRRLAGVAKDLIDDGLFQRFLTVHTKPTSATKANGNSHSKWRAERRARRLWQRLGGDPDDDLIPPRPKGMHWRTYERLIAEAERAETLAGAYLAAAVSKRFGRRLG